MGPNGPNAAILEYQSFRVREKKKRKKKRKEEEEKTRAILQHALSLLPSRRTLAYATRPTTGLDTFSDVTR